MAPMGGLQGGKVYCCTFSTSTTFVMTDFYTTLVGALVPVGKNIPYDLS